LVEISVNKGWEIMECSLKFTPQPKNDCNCDRLAKSRKSRNKRKRQNEQMSKLNMIICFTSLSFSRLPFSRFHSPGSSSSMGMELEEDLADDRTSAEAAIC
jgi:hypothetical protein